MVDFAISLVMLAAAALLAGAVFLHRRGDKQRALLMLVLALVMAGNVAIWLIPTDGGDTLAASAAGE